MDIERFLNRASELRLVKQQELDVKLENEAKALQRKLAAEGYTGSGNAVAAIAKLQTDAIPKRVEEAWQSLVTVHHAMGESATPEIAGAMKAWLVLAIQEIGKRTTLDLLPDFLNRFARFEHRFMSEIDTSGPVTERLEKRYRIELDNYLDKLLNHPKTGGTVINATHIGAVMTGNNSTANVTQHFHNSPELKELVAAMKLAIEGAIAIGPTQKKELLEIASNVDKELARESPNQTMLLTMFTVLAEAVQTIPSAGLLYEQATTLLRSFGVG